MKLGHCTLYHSVPGNRSWVLSQTHDFNIPGHLITRCTGQLPRVVFEIGGVNIVYSVVGGVNSMCMVAQVHESSS